MFESENLLCDVLVIGSGFAGTKAAMEARAEGLSVLLISKGPLGRECCSFYSGGGFRPNNYLESFIPTGCLEGKEDLMGDESAIQRYLSEPELVSVISQRAQKDVDDLFPSLGIPLVKDRKIGRYFPHKYEHGAPGGSLIILPMVKKAREMGVTCLGRVMVAELVVNEGQVKGALAIDKDGKLLKIGAKAIVLATGGGGDAYEQTSAPQGIKGDGYILALKQGVVLENVEFVRFHSCGLAGMSPPLGRMSPLILTDYEGAAMVNGKGENIVEKHLKMSLSRAIDLPLTKLEIVPMIIAHEIKNGNGAYIDLTGISSKDWDEILSHPWQKAFFDKAPVDLRKQKWPLQPTAHTFDGGVKINVKGETSIPGLFAAGEVVGGAAGVAYPDSRCLSMGAIAGRAVVPFVREMKSMQVKEPEWQASISRIKGLMERKGMEKPKELKKTISRVIYAAGGPMRDGPTLEKGIKDLEALDKKINSTKVRNPADLKDALEAENMLILGKALLGAALRRKESRGPHFRSDFPHKDNNWFKRILISQDRWDGPLRFTEEKILANS